jgi:hypothetical protein
MSTTYPLVVHGFFFLEKSTDLLIIINKSTKGPKINKKIQIGHWTT